MCDKNVKTRLNRKIILKTMNYDATTVEAVVKTQRLDKTIGSAVVKTKTISTYYDKPIPGIILTINKAVMKTKAIDDETTQHGSAILCAQ
jgi:hypothetical protein